MSPINRKPLIIGSSSLPENHIVHSAMSLVEPSFIDWITFGFGSKLLRYGATATLQQHHVPALRQHDVVASQQQHLLTEWIRECVLGSCSLWCALYRANKRECLLSGVYAAIESVSCVMQPVFLRELILWLQNPLTRQNVVDGIVIVMFMSIAALIQSISHHQLFYYTICGGWNLRTSCTAIIHDKLLKLRMWSLHHISSGKIINLVTNDVSRFDKFIPFMHFVWTGPIVFVVVLCLTSREVGIAPAVAGASVIMSTCLLQTYFCKYFASLRVETATHTDT